MRQGILCRQNCAIVIADNERPARSFLAAMLRIFPDVGFTKFVRLSRGALANINEITRVSPLPGGIYIVTLRNNQQLNVSRIQSCPLRDQLLKL